MGLFDKKEKVPEIPPAPILPELPKKEGDGKKTLPGLSSFSNISANEALNSERIRSAVTDNLSPEEDEVSVDIPADLHITEESQSGSLIPPKPSSIIPLPPGISTTVQESPKKTLELNASIKGKPVTKQIEPIFVRIDKFQSAQKNFEQIKEKVKEIESVLGKIKEVKSKEEVELTGWTEDIEKIKSRLSEVDAEVFNQI